MGVWNGQLGFIGAGESTLLCSQDTFIGDYFAFVGSPSIPQLWHLIVDGCDVAAIFIGTSFPAGTTFKFTCINDGRIIGLGGNGGNGGDDNGVFGTPPGFNGGTAGFDGIDGGHAISSWGFDIDVDIDDGYLLGGGGGGGGGSFWSDGTPPTFNGHPGGGGGGGAGYSITSAGHGGAPSGVPLAQDGGNGGPTGRGFGGLGGNPTYGFGGNGGGFGMGGNSGGSGNAIMFAWGFLWTGGKGGLAGSAFDALNDASITFTGAKTEAILRADLRLMGEIDFHINLYGIYSQGTSVNSPGLMTLTFGADGELSFDANGFTPPDVGQEWQQTVYPFGGPSRAAHAAGNGDDYQIRASALTEDTGGFGSNPTWDSSPGVDGTWYPLTMDRVWTWTPPVGAGKSSVGQKFEIQRVDALLDTDVLASFYRGFSNTATS
jgi:hypothetical protein